MIPALIAAGAAIGGGLMSASSARKAQKQNLQMSREARAEERLMRQKEYEQQKEFAQSGIRWKVADATKAGLHPLAALGANTLSYAPQSIGSTGIPAASGTDYSFIADAGQHLGRAVNSTSSKPSQVDAYTKAVQALQLDGFQLDNDIKRTELASKIATINQAGSMPGIPGASTRWLLDGAPAAGEIEYTRKQSPSEPGAEFASAGAAPDVMFTRTNSGGYAPVMPENVQEAYENDMIGRWQWMLRNRIIPQHFQKPNIPLGFRESPVYDPWSGEWHSRKAGSSYEHQRFRETFYRR